MVLRFVEFRTIFWNSMQRASLLQWRLRTGIRYAASETLCNLSME
jgi:hypothetical protein